LWAEKMATAAVWIETIWSCCVSLGVLTLYAFPRQQISWNLCYTGLSCQ
jgi:hypothetical protein